MTYPVTVDAEDVARAMCDADLWVGAWEEQKIALIDIGADWREDPRIKRYLSAAPAVMALYAARTAALSQPLGVAQPWQDISTAPRDGTLISAWQKVWKCPISVRYVVSNAPCKWVEATMTTQWPEEAFTHWRPAPEGPAVSSTSRATVPHPDCPCKPGKCIYPECTCAFAQGGSGK